MVSTITETGNCVLTRVLLTSSRFGFIPCESECYCRAQLSQVLPANQAKCSFGKSFSSAMICCQGNPVVTQQMRCRSFRIYALEAKTIRLRSAGPESLGKP